MGRNAKHNFRDGLDHRIVAMNSGSGRRWEVIINKNNYNIGNLWFFPRGLAEFPCWRNSCSSRQSRVVVQAWEQVVQSLVDCAPRFHLNRDRNPKFKCCVYVLNVLVTYTITLMMAHSAVASFMHLIKHNMLFIYGHYLLLSLIKFMWETVLVFLSHHKKLKSLIRPF